MNICEHHSFDFFLQAGAKHKPKGKSGLRSNAHGTRSSGLLDCPSSLSSSNSKYGGSSSSDKWKWNEVIFSNPERILRGSSK